MQKLFESIYQDLKEILRSAPRHESLFLEKIGHGVKVNGHLTQLSRVSDGKSWHNVIVVYHVVTNVKVHTGIRVNYGGAAYIDAIIFKKISTLRLRGYG